jgi:DNA topoisomerase-2
MPKSTKSETETKSEAEKYDKKTPREHVLIRPDTYIGDIEPTTENMWVYSETENKMLNKQITYTPGFLKTFDELIVNARDASINDSTCDTIKVEYNVEEGFISIYNNGDIGIPVEEHPTHKSLVPSMIFGELLTSSNYNDNEERTTGGRNGYGSKCLCPNTKIPLWNGEIKLAKDIKINDKLIGDDGTIRNVLKVTEGIGKMYDVLQSHGEPYRVNDEHILTLHMPDHKVIYWNNTKCGWSMVWWNNETKSINSKNFRAYKPEIKCDKCGVILVDNLNRHMRRCHPEIEITKKLRKSPVIIPDDNEYVKDARNKIEEFSKTINDNNTFDISIKDYIKLNETTKRRLAGVRGKCVQWKTKEVLLDPYVLGLWLGDGMQSGYSYACYGEKDIQIIDYLKKWGETNDATIKQSRKYAYNIVSTNNFRKKYCSPLKNLLEKYNLINNKHIPNEYIVNDRETRLKVLAGIIDTDGTVCRDGTRIIITQGLMHKQLVYDIVKLSRSLGYSSQLTIKNTEWTYNNEIKKGKAYNINISGENIIDIPTKLPRKKCADTISKNTSYSSGFIEIKESEYNQFIGFEIDKNQRFVINDFTVTHNCANIFSTKFIVEVDDAKRNKRFKQTWTDNMGIAEEAIVTKLPAKTKSSVKVTFYPDFKRFNIKDLNNDHSELFHRRSYDIAGTANNKLKVYFNEKKIDVINFKSYIELYYPTKDIELFYDNGEERWTVGVLYKPDKGGDVISFVNSINTYKGGTHCNHVIDSLIKTLINDYIKKKEKDIKITPTILKENLVFFINSTIINPAFSSQTKDTLTTKIDKFGSKYTPTPAFLKKLAKCGIVEQMIELAKFKENSNLKKTDGKKQVKISGIPKLEDANKAGTKESSKCTLILTEGDSAKATAMAGLGVIGRDYYGVFPLKGKLLNVREAAASQLLANEEIKNLKLIIGLKQGEDYSTDDKFSTLRYGHILLLTDQDVDGSHIKGLFINMLHSLWPSLVKRAEFVQSLNTPIVKAIKGSNIVTFYNLTDYDNWKDTPEANNYKIKYYKGLGTSTTQEAKEYFIDIETKIINYFWENVDKEVKAKFSDSNKTDEQTKIDDVSDEESENEVDEDIFIPIHDDDDAIRLAFDKSRADDRKKWLLNYNKNNVIKYEQKIIPYYDFIHSDLIHFSNDDLIRSIPSVIDGLKPSQRKILYGAYLRGLDKTEVKVAQLAGFVSDKAAYHHGEMSLTGAIIGMAQDFVGSNNINILVPAGQFGTRLKGGKDAASPRYIWTSIEKLTSIIYNSIDDPILNNQFEDNEPIEPEYYAPIIPMILVNGAEGIGTGFSTKIPPYNPIEIIKNIKNIMNNKPFEQMDPWWQGFEGIICKIDEFNYEIFGTWSIDNNKLTITELPVGEWTSNYKEFLEKMLEDTPVKVKPDDKKGKKQPKKDNNFLGYKDSNTESKVNFELTFEDGYLSTVKDIDKLFHLNKKYSITNMHLYGPKGHIKRYHTVEEIIQDYYYIRLKLYKARKEYQLGILEYQLKIISYKVKFILMVVQKELEINNKKKQEIEESLIKNNFPKFGKNKSDNKLTYDYLLSMPIYNLSYEKIEELKKQHQDKETEYKELDILTPENIWSNELDILEEEYLKWYKLKSDLANSTGKKKIKKSKK